METHSIGEGAGSEDDPYPEPGGPVFTVTVGGVVRLSRLEFSVQSVRTRTSLVR